MKYVKKPIVIDAEPYREGMEDGKKCINPNMSFCQDTCGCCPDYKPYIKTLEGYLYIDNTDMIITGVKGERYPCKLDIFNMTYEKVKG